MFRLAFLLVLTVAVRCQASTVTLPGSIIHKVVTPSNSRSQHPFRTTFGAGRSRRSKSYPKTGMDEDDDHLLDSDDYTKVEEWSVRIIPTSGSVSCGVEF